MESERGNLEPRKARVFEDASRVSTRANFLAKLSLGLQTLFAKVIPFVITDAIRKSYSVHGDDSATCSPRHISTGDILAPNLHGVRAAADPLQRGAERGHLTTALRQDRVDLRGASYS